MTTLNSTVLALCCFIIRYFPVNAGGDPILQPTSTPRGLGPSIDVEVTHPAGSLKLFAVFSDEPFTGRRVEEAAQAAAKAHPCSEAVAEPFPHPELPAPSADCKVDLAQLDRIDLPGAQLTGMIFVE